MAYMDEGIRPRDYIDVDFDGDEFVVFNINDKTSRRFPVTPQGAEDAIMSTCGYFRITLAAKHRMATMPHNDHPGSDARMITK